MAIDPNDIELSPEMKQALAMTRRTVVWVSEAESELAEIWLASKSRDRVTSASHAIDDALGNDAESAGSLLAEGMRVLDEPPLRVLFEI